MIPLTGLLCLLFGCENSVSYGNQGINLPELPAYVRNQKGPISIPQGPLRDRDVAPLLLQLRKSELQKWKAIQIAKKERQQLIWLYKQRAGSNY